MQKKLLLYWNFIYITTHSFYYLSICVNSETERYNTYDIIPMRLAQYRTFFMSCQNTQTEIVIFLSIQIYSEKIVNMIF